MNNSINTSFKSLQTQNKIDSDGHIVEEIKNRSAGIVIVRKEQNKLFLLMMRAYHYWDFPKGKIEIGERVIDAAIRETKEEAGIDDLHFSWGVDHTQTEPYGSIQKISYYFLAETEQSKITMAINPEIGKPEHEEYRWLTFEEAKRISVPRLQKVIDWAEFKINTI